MVIDEVLKSGFKRKREKVKIETLTLEERENRLKSLNEELESLFRYFDELLSVDLGLDSHVESVLSSNSLNMNVLIVVLMEEKCWSYSKLVSEVFERVKEKDNGVTISSVKSSVLFVGQRMAYGVPKADADVLEDETRSCLWCWEARDMKLLPKSLRGALKVRRTCRKKINERITAILDMISCLRKSEDHPTYKHDMLKATEKVGKVLAEADIRFLVQNLLPKNDFEMAEDIKKQATPSKELENKKREAEKEKKRMDKELQKEKLQSEKVRKRLQKKAEKDEKGREREESELRKQLKRNKKKLKENNTRKKRKMLK